MNTPIATAMPALKSASAPEFADLARKLALARTMDRRCVQPPELEAGLECAYAIQEQTLRNRGDALAGYKLAFTDASARSALGLHEPVVGLLAVDDILLSPAEIVTREHLRIVEAEVVFRLAADLPPRTTPYSSVEVASATGELLAGIEVCNTRYLHDDGLSPVQIAADNAFAHCLVLGQPICAAPGDLHDLTAQLRISGSLHVTGSTGRVTGGPLAAVTWLANWLGQRGKGLVRGQLVASGSCTGQSELPWNEEATATLDTACARVRIRRATLEQGNPT